MATFRRAALLITALALAGCPKEAEEHPTPASPAAASGDAAASGEAGASGGALSLADALPSPIPSMVRPSMPPQLPGAFIFYDDFEKGMGKWAVTGNAKDLGWHLLNAATCGGLWTMVLGKPLNEEHQGQACEAYLSVKQAIDLRKAKRPQLQYDLKGVSLPPELIAVQAQVRKKGQGPWADVGPVAHGSLPLVLTFVADLTPYAGSELELRFRGQLKAAPKATKGFYLDDVHIVEPRE